MHAQRVLAVCTGLLSAAPFTMAAQVSTPFTASASVVRGCVIAATNLAFGPYPALGTAPAVLATSTITVTCNVGDTFTIGLNSGANGSGGMNPTRRMARTAAPIDWLNYSIYRDPARTLEWGDTGLTRVRGTGTGSAQTFPVYGELPGAQTVPVGAYVDTVTVSVRN